MNEMIKVAHLISGRQETLSGADRVVLDLLKRINKNKFKCWLLCFEESRFKDLPLIAKKARNIKIDTHLMQSRGKLDFRCVRQISQFIQDNQIDILHCHGYKADIIGYLASRDLNIERVTTLHGWWYGRSIKLNLYRWLDHFTISKFDKVVTVSKPIKSLLIDAGFSFNKVVYIPNGVDFEQINKADGSRIKNIFNIKKDKVLAGTAWRLSKEKGYEYLLLAVKDIPNLILLIIGEGPLKSKLIKLGKKLNIEDKVIFTGFRDDIYDLIASMDIFVLPSISEGLPLVLLEAMALQKPVIATCVGDIPDIIKDEKTGILVRPKKADELNKAIRKLLDNKSFTSTISINGRKFVEKNYSTLIMVKKYESIYLEIASNR